MTASFERPRKDHGRGTTAALIGALLALAGACDDDGSVSRDAGTFTGGADGGLPDAPRTDAAADAPPPDAPWADVAASSDGPTPDALPFCGKAGNQALRFSGKQVVRAADSASLHLSDITVEAWVTFVDGPAVSTYQTVVAKPYGTASGDSFALWYEGGGLHAGANPTNTADALGFVFNPVRGRWYHAAFTYESATKVQKLYLDGALVASGAAPRENPVYDSHPLLVGADTDYDQFSGGWLGDIDEVRIWTSVRSAGQILEDIATCSPGVMPGLAAYYPLDEGAGTVAHDLGGQGNDGTLGHAGPDDLLPAWVPAATPFGGNRDR